MENKKITKEYLEQIIGGTKVLPFFDGTNRLFFIFLYLYIKWRSFRMLNAILQDISLEPLFLMVIRLFRKKAVPLHCQKKK